MHFKIGLALAVFGVLVAGAAVGQDDPIAARKQLMKTNNAAAKTAFEMIQGKTPYDAAAAANAMQDIATDMDQVVALFPEGSDQGDTAASPDIWKNMDDFKALAAKLNTDAKAAADAAAGGVDAFKVAFNTVGGDCGACHKKYRTK